MLSSGHLLDNRYRLDERIATGGMGDVWRGTDVILARVVAVKVLRAAMLADPEFAARFYGEARMLAAFRHPGVVEVYDYNSAAECIGQEDTCAYLVMAFVDGEPLSDRLRDGARLGVAETMSIVAQAADALHAAHEAGTVHRDVKPGNLMVKPNGTVILVDFGVARSVAVTSVTGINSIVGTALYMAPEQVSKGDLSPATDIYALGAVAYQCLAGRPPFDGDNALQVALRHLEDEPDPLPDDVPLPVQRLISRAMAKNPADRFVSAAAFADAALAAGEDAELAGYAEDDGDAPATAATTAIAAPMATAVRPTYAPVPSPRPDRRVSRRLTAVLAFVAALAVAGIAFATFVPDGGEDARPPGDGTPVSQAPAAPIDGPSESAEPEVPVQPSPTVGRPSQVPTPTGPSSAVSVSPPVRSSSPSPSRSAVTSAPPTSAPPTEGDKPSAGPPVAEPTPSQLTGPAA